MKTQAEIGAMQGAPQTAATTRNEKRKGRLLPQSLQRGERPWDTLMSQCHLQNHERITVCCSESLCLCHLLRQLQETKIPPSPNLFSPQQPRDPGHIFPSSNPTMALLSFRVKAKVLTVIRMTPHHPCCPLDLADHISYPFSCSLIPQPH